MNIVSIINKSFFLKRYGTGILSKSPDEIAEWLKEKRGDAKPRSNLSKKQSNKILASLKQRKPVAINKNVKQKKELLPTSQEWDLLRNIKPDNAGLYTLGIKNVGVRKNLALNAVRTSFVMHCTIWYHLFKKREKHPWRSVTFSKVVDQKFSKLYKWYHITQNITSVLL